MVVLPSMGSILAGLTPKYHCPVDKKGVEYCESHFVSVIYLPTGQNHPLKFPVLEKRSQKHLDLPLQQPF